MIHPLTARAFVTNALKTRVDAWLQAEGSDVRVNDRIYPARKGLKPEGYPYIVVSVPGDGEESEYVTWADEILLERSEILVMWCMSSQAVPLGQDLEEFVASIDGALQDALSDVHAAGPIGTVHGCKLCRPYRPPVHGDDEEMFCEMGWFVQVTCN